MDLIIPTMRKSALDRVIAHYLALDEQTVRRVIVVDFDPSFPSSRQVREISRQTARLTHVSVPNQTYFNKPRALNLGVSLSNNEWVMICDADVLIAPPSIDLMVAEARAGRVAVLGTIVESETGDRRAGPGIVCLRRRDFLAVEGYDSQFEGWGLEDRDFLGRLERSGRRVIALGEGLHLTHCEDERTGNYQIADRRVSREANRCRLQAGLRQGTLLGTYTRDCSAMAREVCEGLNP